MPEIVAAGPGAIVRKPDRAVRFDDDIVGGGQALSLEAFGEDGNRTVIFGAGQALRVHLPGDKTALAVAGVAVGVMGGPTEDADGAGFLLPFHDAVVRDVAPQQIAPVAEPYRPLGKAAAAGDAFDRRVAQDIFLEPRIEHLDV